MTQRPVLVEIKLRLPATLELVTAAMLLILVGGISLGVFSAMLGRGERSIGQRVHHTAGGQYSRLLDRIDPGSMFFSFC